MPGSKHCLPTDCSNNLWHYYNLFFLPRPKMRNSFNMLLIALALFDTCYNAASLMETARKCFGAASRQDAIIRLPSIVNLSTTNLKNSCTGQLRNLSPIFGGNQFGSSPGLWAATAQLPKLIATEYRTQGAEPPCTG